MWAHLHFLLVIYRFAWTNQWHGRSIMAKDGHFEVSGPMASNGLCAALFTPSNLTEQQATPTQVSSNIQPGRRNTPMHSDVHSEDPLRTLCKYGLPPNHHRHADALQLSIPTTIGTHADHQIFILALLQLTKDNVHTNQPFITISVSTTGNYIAHLFN